MVPLLTHPRLGAGGPRVVAAVVGILIACGRGTAAAAAAAGASRAGAPARPPVDAAQVQQIIEMGFPQAAAELALRRARSPRSIGLLAKAAAPVGPGWPPLWPHLACASAATWSGPGRLAQASGHGANMWGAAASGLPLRLREAAGGASGRAPLGQDTVPYPNTVSCGACAGRQPRPQHGGAGHRLAHLAPGGGRGGGRAGRRGARRRRRGRGGRVRRRPAARRGAAARRGRAGARAGARQGAGGRRAGERTAALSASVAHALSRGAAALACSGTPRWCARGDAKPYRVQER